MNSFYLRTENQAILIGDRDIYIRRYFDAGPFNLCISKLQVSEDYGDFNVIYTGTEEHCQKMLDWIMQNIPMGQSAGVIDARKFIKHCLTPIQKKAF
jgi:hypothetical protein